jgi:hypothetical protein
MDRQARDLEWEQTIQSRRFRHPETKQMDKFVSLPPVEQARLRALFSRNRETMEENKPKGRGFREKMHDAIRGAKKFFTDRDYRDEVVSHIQEKAGDFKDKLKQEMHESADLARTLKSLVQGKEISDEERDAAKEQVIDLAKMAFIAGSAVTPVPGFKLMPWLLTAAVNKAFHKKYSIAPSAWRTAGDEMDQVIETLFHSILEEISHPDEHLYEAVMSQLHS